MTLGLLDLSIVTDRLLKQLTDCTAASRLWTEEPTPPQGTPQGATPTVPFTIYFTGLPPDVAHGMTNCRVSLYLFHVAPDKFQRNTFPSGGRAQEIPQQPLALTLYYLLSAHSKDSYIEEQQAMSIALKCFHDHPVVSATVPVDDRVEEFTLTMEPQGIDELGRLWQSASTPLRLSAVYRASVIFLEPEAPAAPAPRVLKPEVKAYPQTVITRATVNLRGLATIIGGGFVAGSTVAQIDGVDLHPTTLSPPGPNGVLVASATKLLVQLPSGTAKGQYRLRVQLDSEHPPAVFTLVVPGVVS